MTVTRKLALMPGSAMTKLTTLDRGSPQFRRLPKNKSHLAPKYQMALSKQASFQALPADQWNCSSSVEPVKALTEDEPPWITVVTSSK
jgi:hypothetical protein